MTKQQEEVDPRALLVVLAIIFVSSGAFLAWWTIQKIHFFQGLFKFSFWMSIVFVVSSVILFITFLLKEDRDSFMFGSDEFFNKATFGVMALVCLILALAFFTVMIKSYEKGYSDEAILKLAEAQGKLDEFNYIRDVLTGAEIERLMIEGFEEALEDICKSDDRDCNQIRTSYQSINNILEMKKKADNIAGFFGLIKK